MNSTKEMKTWFFAFAALVVVVFVGQAQAAVSGTVVCKTAFGEKEITIDNDHVAFNREDDSGVKREISSVNSVKVRTHNKYKGFTKTLYIDGMKHKVHVEDATDFNEVQDYLSITSPKGHEMTYPLTCHQA
jgi:TRAP-type C4-dicarboxylate transport system substrate-binding protein